MKGRMKGVLLILAVSCWAVRGSVKEIKVLYEKERSIDEGNPLTEYFNLPAQKNFLSYSVEVSGILRKDEEKSRISVAVIDQDEALTASLHGANGSSSTTFFLCPKRDFSNVSLTLSASTRSEGALIFRFVIRSVSLILPLGRTELMEVRTGLPLTLRVDPQASYRDYFVLSVDSADYFSNDVCVIVGAADGKCPLKNTPETVVASDIWQTALSSATITIRARTFSFSEPFFVSVVVMPNDFPCHSGRQTFHQAYDNQIRHKKISISVVKGDGYLSYLIPILVSIGILFSVVAISCLLVGAKTYKYYDEADMVDRRKDEMEEDVVQEERALQENINHVFVLDEEERCYNLFQRCQEAAECRKEDAPNRYERIIVGMRRFKRRPRVSDLIKISTKDSWFRRNRSRVYCYLLPLVCLFYFVPAIQFAFMAKSQEENTGSQDICFHNFRCSKPFSIFTDFNHIISNSSYIIYGFSFMVIVCIKKNKLPMGLNNFHDNAGYTGVPQQLSIFLALGFALMAQGFFSVCYHVCPTNLSLQFDTTMMYFICTLSIIKIYQFRHPDATANAYSTFGFIWIIVFLEAITLYTSSWLAFAPFLILYVLFTMLIAVDSYFMGIGRIDRIIGLILFKHTVSGCFCTNSEKCQRGPLFLSRFVWGLLFVGGNVSYAVYSAVSKYRNPEKNLSHVVLLILASNLFAYLLYYITLKVFQQNFTESGRFNPLHVFKICGKTYKLPLPTGTIFGVMAILFGGMGIYLYSSRSANRNLSPAESRNLNAPCSWMHFYDNHDIWHFCSATSVFAAFISLLTIDDDLLYTNRNEIDVF